MSYFGKIRNFGWNARLYLLHIFGMDVIHGAWEVLFNLYLLAIGFPVTFIGLRLAVLGVATAIASIPAGRLADRIDRKWGFIIGDGGGAICSLVLIMSIDGTTILAVSAISACFGALHHVTEILSLRKWWRYIFSMLPYAWWLGHYRITEKWNICLCCSRKQ